MRKPQEIMFDASKELLKVLSVIRNNPALNLSLDEKGISKIEKELMDSVRELYKQK